VIEKAVFVRTGSWTGPPQGERAPRVGTSQDPVLTVFWPWVLRHRRLQRDYLRLIDLCITQL
jgi:hypothetical protein